MQNISKAIELCLEESAIDLPQNTFIGIRDIEVEISVTAGD
jgi:hypothetical protein